jgi:hypothetical protein
MRMYQVYALAAALLMGSAGTVFAQVAGHPAGAPPAVGGEPMDEPPAAGADPYGADPTDVNGPGAAQMAPDEGQDNQGPPAAADERE